jgi:hypothetical protein
LPPGTIHNFGSSSGSLLFYLRLEEIEKSHGCINSRKKDQVKEGNFQGINKTPDLGLHGAEAVRNIYGSVRRTGENSVRRFFSFHIKNRGFFLFW